MFMVIIYYCFHSLYYLLVLVYLLIFGDSAPEPLGALEPRDLRLDARAQTPRQHEVPLRHACLLPGRQPDEPLPRSGVPREQRAGGAVVRLPRLGLEARDLGQGPDRQRPLGRQRRLLVVALLRDVLLVAALAGCGPGPAQRAQGQLVLKLLQRQRRWVHGPEGRGLRGLAFVLVCRAPGGPRGLGSRQERLRRPPGGPEAARGRRGVRCGALQPDARERVLEVAGPSGPTPKLH